MQNESKQTCSNYTKPCKSTAYSITFNPLSRRVNYMVPLVPNYTSHSYFIHEHQTKQLYMYEMLPRKINDSRIFIFGSGSRCDISILECEESWWLKMLFAKLIRLSLCVCARCVSPYTHPPVVYIRGGENENYPESAHAGARACIITLHPSSLQVTRAWKMYLAGTRNDTFHVSIHSAAFHF